MDQYEIVFKGEVMPKLDVEEVAAALAGLFKSGRDKIDPLFDGRSHTLKSGLARDAAEQYREALKQAGAIVYLRRLAAANRLAERSTATGRANGGLSIAPMLGNLLRAEERIPSAVVVVDTSGIELAANDGSALQAPAEPAPPAPDTSHISLAEAGADLNPDPLPHPAPAEPATGSMTLAPPDIERLTDPAPLVDQPIPDTSALQVEPAGEILKPHEKPAPAPAPVLQHDFSLCDSD